MRKTIHAVAAEFSGFPLDDVPLTVERRQVWDGEEYSHVVDVEIGTGDAFVKATLLQQDADALAEALRGVDE